MNNEPTPSGVAGAGGLRTRVTVALWITLVVAGMAMLTAYANEPGATAPAPKHLAPSTLGPPATAAPFRLVMFVHPRCPCSRASLRELARIMARVGERVAANVYLYRPERESDAWTDGDLRESAERIPGVQVLTDPDGRLAAEMGSRTSGDVLLYDAAGKLRFHGGITSSRGHEGDNLGASAVTSLVLGESAGAASAPVFGCSLQREELPRE